MSTFTVRFTGAVGGLILASLITRVRKVYETCQAMDDAKAKLQESDKAQKELAVKLEHIEQDSNVDMLNFEQGRWLDT